LILARARRSWGKLFGRAEADRSSWLLLGVGMAGFLVYELLLLRPHLPVEILLLGMVFGCLNALPALGLVLIYRTNRVINFAQGELGGFAAVLATELMFYKNVPYVLAVLTALFAAALAGALVEICVVRVFATAPRLILTVATIGVAQILAALELITPSFFGEVINTLYQLPAPFSLSFSLGVVTFDGAAILTLMVAPLLALALFLFLRGTILGAAIRAAAEDSPRARALGIPVMRLSTLVWVIAAVVSGLASILSARVYGIALGHIPGPGFLLRSLAPAAIGRFDNLGLTFVAAVALGMVEQGIFFNTGANGPVELTLFVVILLALLLRAPVLGRLAHAETSTFTLIREVHPIAGALRRLPEIRALRLVPSLCVLAGLIVLPHLLRPDQVSLVQSILIYGMVGVSLVLLSGYAGQISLGQWAIAGVGSFTAAQMFTSLQGHGFFDDFFVDVLCGALCGALVSMVIGLPALRIGSYLLAVATLAFSVAASSELFRLRFIHIPEILPRPKLFDRFNTYDETTFYYLVLIAFVLSFAAVANFRRGRRGRLLVAMRDNEVGTTALGFGPLRAKLGVFILSGFIAALAGALYAFQNTALGSASPDRFFPPERSLALFAIVVFGGLGSPAGAVLGAAVIVGIDFFAPTGYDLLASGAGILLLLYFAPGGIGQIVYGVRDALVRAVAQRRALPGPSPPRPGGEPGVTAGAPAAGGGS